MKRHRNVTESGVLLNRVKVSLNVTNFITKPSEIFFQGQIKSERNSGYFSFRFVIQIESHGFQGGTNNLVEKNGQQCCTYPFLKNLKLFRADVSL